MTALFSPTQGAPEMGGAARPFPVPRPALCRGDLRWLLHKSHPAELPAPAMGSLKAQGSP